MVESASGAFVRMSRKIRKNLDSFVCQRCGTCCSGPGFVHIHADECASIARELGIPLEEFLEKYTVREADGERFLKDGDGEDEPCIFLERDARGLSSCRVQGPAKPRQCQGFPFSWRRPGFEKWCKGMRD